MKKLVIIGASGHGKVVADIAIKNGYNKIIFLDDDESIHECGGYPIVGKSSEGGTIDADVIIGIGNAGARKRIQESIPDEKLVTLIHPDAVVAEDVVIGKGAVVMAGAVINPGVRIGKGCIINTCSSADHDCEVGDYVHIAVGSHLCGTVNVGDKKFGAMLGDCVEIGCGSVLNPGTVIGRNCNIYPLSSVRGCVDGNSIYKKQGEIAKKVLE